MLSIRFDDDREWWVSSHVFERLLLSALDHGQITLALEEWRHVADANGGFSLADVEPATARDLKAGLRAAASTELARLGDAELCSEDRNYKVSLEKLLAVTDDGASTTM
jgi:hypothetical protein